jgi:hypothetical protein
VIAVLERDDIERKPDRSGATRQMRHGVGDGQSDHFAQRREFNGSARRRSKGLACFDRAGHGGVYDEEDVSWQAINGETSLKFRTSPSGRGDSFDTAPEEG